MCNGDVIVEFGARANITGMIEGKIVNNGGLVTGTGKVINSGVVTHCVSIRKDGTIRYTEQKVEHSWSSKDTGSPKA